MLDLGSTSFDISPEAVKAFSIAVVSSKKAVQSNAISENNLETEALFTVPLVISFADHRSLNEKDYAFEEIKASADYHALIPALYWEKHKARGPTTCHIHAPHCPSECYGQGKIHQEISITYDSRI